MTRPLPALPRGFSWRRRGAGGGSLRIWGVVEVATVERAPNGWISRVNVCFHASLHREALAGSKRQACYWVHRWAWARAETLYRARPEACVMVVPGSLG